MKNITKWKQSDFVGGANVDLPPAAIGANQTLRMLNLLPNGTNDPLNLRSGFQEYGTDSGHQYDHGGIFSIDNILAYGCTGDNPGSVAIYEAKIVSFEDGDSAEGTRIVNFDLSFDEDPLLVSPDHALVTDETTWKIDGTDTGAPVEPGKTYSITPYATAGGDISPATVQTVANGDDITFTITPDDETYEIRSVKVNGVDVGAVGTYTITNVAANGSIEAIFGLADDTPLVYFHITASTGANGSIVPNGVAESVSGESKIFNFNPATDYTIDEILVDGTAVTLASSYTFENVSATHTISVTFKLKSKVYTTTLSRDLPIIGLPEVGTTFIAGDDSWCDTNGKIGGVDAGDNDSYWGSETNNYTTEEETHNTSSGDGTGYWDTLFGSSSSSRLVGDNWYSTTGLYSLLAPVSPATKMTIERAYYETYEDIYASTVHEPVVHESVITFTKPNPKNNCPVTLNFSYDAEHYGGAVLCYYKNADNQVDTWHPITTYGGTEYALVLAEQKSPVTSHFYDENTTNDTVSVTFNCPPINVTYRIVCIPCHDFYDREIHLGYFDGITVVS
jgi:hypothetical protein